MTALLNFEQTLVTSTTCSNCATKIYTPKPDANLSRTTNFTHISPIRTSEDIEYEGLEVVD